ncbi:hypothetical protein JOB18_040156 [Solea senegalensis]|uniref:Uncharacterized protein n=1 Tax=Solea senegalensis TaxID=28829 RepID=A0AAV6Q453_SOLSE|nr:hypothetical protein JOB18_040156 [Solea senegalensis]
MQPAVNNTQLSAILRLGSPTSSLGRRNRDSVGEYVIKFRAAAAATLEWNDAALQHSFHRGLSAAIKDTLAPLESPPDLDPLIDLAIRLGFQLREREKERRQEHVVIDPHG